MILAEVFLVAKMMIVELHFSDFMRASSVDCYVCLLEK